MGISTLTAGYALHEMMFNDDYKILVIATTQEVAKSLVEKVQLMFELLPNFLKQGGLSIVNKNKLSLVFSNGSSIKAVSSSPDAARSASLSLLICDEFAFVESSEAIWTSAQMTLATGGKCIILSTPNGTGNTFHDLWVKAEEGVADGIEAFNPIKLPWYLHPERDQKWRDGYDHLLGKRQAAQECFDGDTRVLTETGYKCIKDIRIGELVFTHKGRLRPVVRVMSHISNNCVELYSSNNRLKKSFVTKNHPFLTDNGWVNVGDFNNEHVLCNLPDFEIKSSTSILDLYDVLSPVFFKKKLTEDANRFYINDRRHKKEYFRYIPIDWESGHLIGLYLAKGSKTRTRLIISCNAEHELNKWKLDLFEKLNKLFGQSPINDRVTGKNTGQISISSTIISGFIDFFVEGTSSSTKKLSKNTYIYGNYNFFKGILEGYLQGDGCLLEKYKKTSTTVSLELLYDLKSISDLLNIKNTSIRRVKTAGVETIEGRIVNIRESYYLSYKRNKNIPYSFKNSYSCDVKNRLIISEGVVEDVKVYNLEVYEDHTYITEHGVVHNCDCDFLTSGHTVIEADILAEYDAKTIEPLEKRGVEGDLWIWKYPDPIKDYIVVLDPARGDGEDNSGMQVIDVETCEQVAEYRGKIDTQSFGRMGVAVATEYGNALLVIDNKNVGWSTVQVALDLGYKNLYYSYKNDPYLDENIHLRKNYDLKNKEDMIPGLTTTTRLRPVFVSKLEMYFRERTPIIYSKRFMNELRVFVWHDGKPQAQRGKTDDLVMCWAMGMYIRDTALRMRQMGIELIKNAIRNTHKSVYKPQPIGADKWQMDVRGQKENLKWLL
jgi:hypothetical protein